MIALRALGALLTYPRRELLEALPEIGAAIAGSRSLVPASQQRLSGLLSELRSTDPFDLEERYVELFDRSRSTSLYLFEHVHGDSRERGQAMVDLKSIYERAGFRLASGELPDYLPALLEYLSCRSLEETRDMLGDCAHVLRAIGQRFAGRGSRYAAVFDALLAVAGESGLDWSAAPAPPEPARGIDEDWMDAPAFGPGADAGVRPQSMAGLHSERVRASAALPRAPHSPPVPGVESDSAPAMNAGEVPLRFMPRASR